MNNKVIDLLRQDYCPPLDVALLSAIASDYDLGDEVATKRLRFTLEALKEDALLLEAEGYDALTTDEVLLAAESTSSAAMDDTSLREMGSGSRGTENSSLPDGMSHLNIKDAGISSSSSAEDDESSDWVELEKVAPETRLALLMEMFPSLQDLTIKHCLKEAGDNVKRVVEELLTYVFIEQEAAERDEDLILKGVEGFAVPENVRRARKSKGKRRGRQFTSSDERSSSSSVVPIDNDATDSSRWDVMGKEIEFIASRTGLPTRSVASVYHASGASTSSTLKAILESEIKIERDEDLDDDPMIQVNAMQLGEEFPSIPPQYLEPLIRLTHPSTASAHELAKELVAKPRSNNESSGGGVEIITKLPPIVISDFPSSSSSSPSKIPPPAIRLSASHASALSTSYAQARHTAFSQATAAHRRSRSNHLMGAAAGYYGGVGRDYDRKARMYSAAAANALVAAASTDTELDLHGVCVADAVRIARAKVRAWWEGLGDSRYEAKWASTRFYRIITGMGKHSEDRKAKVGPAVARMLMREGWKIQFEQGALTVLGRGNPRRVGAS
ncbi:MAG: hypothetical protein M1816_007479 [Peltula sp. TS41687]|nr:MAG: hypothetical protein M1816_007479 [Peltula sp. TS41687]